MKQTVRSLSALSIMILALGFALTTATAQNIAMPPDANNITASYNSDTGTVIVTASPTSQDIDGNDLTGTTQAVNVYDASGSFLGSVLGTVGQDQTVSVEVFMGLDCNGMSVIVTFSNDAGESDPSAPVPVSIPENVCPTPMIPFEESGAQ